MDHNNSHLDIFKGVTSLTELNVTERYEMVENNHLIDDFSDDDKVENQVDFWKYQENPEIIGYFDRFEADGYGEHIVLNVDEKELHLPNLTALNGKTKTAGAVKGSKMKVVYKGEVKAEKSGRMYKDFDVFVK